MNKVVPVIFMFLSSFAYADELMLSDFTLENRGTEVCKNSPQAEEPCFKTLRSLGLELADDVEDLYSQIDFHNQWLAFSPGKLPTNPKYLKQMGGAILLTPSNSLDVTAQLTELSVKNLSIKIDSPPPLSEIPFALTIDWKDKSGHKGSLNAIGHLKVVDGIFNLDLDDIFKFRDRFASNVHVDAISGSLIPLRLNEANVDSTEDIARQVVAPCLAGKFVSFARIGFDQMKQELQQKLDEILKDEIEKSSKRRTL